jgi:nucleoside-diphosphate-sugar epimerase
MTARRVLVTGASGFVGRPAVEALVARGYEVHVISRRAIDRRPAGLPDGVVAHAADLLDPSGVEMLLGEIRPSHMLHLAWDVTPGRFWQAPENLDWVAASLRLYRAFVASGGNRVVVAGTCAEYDWSADLLDEAATPIRPGTLYGTAKDALHRVLAAAALQDGVVLAWGRLFFMYGPREAPNRLVSDVARALLRGEPALCGPGTAERDFMHVADVGGALAATLDSAFVGPVNIATGDCVPIRAVVDTLAELTGRPDLVRLGARPAPKDEPPRLAASVTVLREGVGFAPRFTLAEGLADTLAWWRDRV